MQGSVLAAWVLVLLLGSGGAAIAEVEVDADDGIEIATLISEEQLQSLIAQENYSAKGAVKGVCYGITHINLALITKIDFNPNEPVDPPGLVYRALINAVDLPSRQTISGYANAKEFTDAMQEHWKDESNPLRLAVEHVQIHQSTHGFLAPRAVRAMKLDAAEVTLKQAIEIERGILRGAPVQLAIYNDKGLHSLLVVGYRRPIDQKHPRDFLVLDPVYPRQLMHLEVVSYDRNDRGGERGEHWFYQPWQDVYETRMELKKRDPGSLSAMMDEIMETDSETVFTDEKQQLLRLTEPTSLSLNGMFDFESRKKVDEMLKEVPYAIGGDVFVQTIKLRHDQTEAASSTMHIAIR